MFNGIFSRIFMRGLRKQKSSRKSLEYMDEEKKWKIKFKNSQFQKEFGERVLNSEQF